VKYCAAIILTLAVATTAQANYDYEEFLPEGLMLYMIFDNDFDHRFAVRFMGYA